MIRPALLLLAIGSLLSGCATPPPVPGPHAGGAPIRHHVVRHPRPHVVAVRSAAGRDAAYDRALSALTPHSPEWWALRQRIDADEDRRLNAKLVICRGCFTPAAPADQTGSLEQ